MVVGEGQTAVDRYLPSGNESGTAPEDRPFRPDVQGLRAVAVLLVVLFHAGVPGFGGGFVGVDVFFVISGFVITGVLLRERQATGSTSILGFYARRARRIIPAATVVVIVGVLATYHFLGSVAGSQTAADGRWAAVFLANFHFAANGTNYLASLRLPSPLQNYWSLAVEEQFYLVYPTLFVVVAWPSVRLSSRARLGALLSVVVAASFLFSIVETSANASAAYFSPFTRAWELALGALVALCTRRLGRVPPQIGAAMSWVGLGAIALAGFAFSATMAYPGAAAALPVLGAVFVIAGGAAAPTRGVESVLRVRPLQWLGLISYSLYLWHWPVLTIAAERRGVTHLPVLDNLAWIMFALVLATITYLLVENPFRHLNFLVTRHWASVAMGGSLIVSTVVVTTASNAGATPTAYAMPIDTAPVDSWCPSPAASELTSLRASFLSGADAPTTLHPAHALRVLLVGDSTACTLLPGIDAVSPSYGVHVDDAAVIGCGVVSNRMAPDVVDGIDFSVSSWPCRHEVATVESAALRRGPPDVVLWSSEWERKSIVGPQGRDLVSGTPAWRRALLHRMNARLDQFAAEGAITVLLTQPTWTNLKGQGARTQFADLNDLLRQAAARHPGRVVVVDLASRVCPSGTPCLLEEKGQTIRPDGAHYGSSGSLWVARWLVPHFLAAVDKARSTNHL
jgi:peptidoglycan/LPS O-acetylase OafA/YrhL